MDERRFEVDGTLVAVTLEGMGTASAKGASCEDEESGKINVVKAWC